MPLDDPQPDPPRKPLLGAFKPVGEFSTHQHPRTERRQWDDRVTGLPDGDRRHSRIGEQDRHALDANDSG